MTTSQPTPLPPTTIHSIRFIPQSAAHDFLSAYLERATTDPALQPNATVSEHGPVSRTTAAAPNLILHNLKRIQAGLAGEVLSRDLTLPSRDVHDTGYQQHRKKTGDVDAAAAAAEEGWEDREKWGVGQVDLMNVGDDDDMILHTQAGNDPGEEQVMGMTGGSAAVDKEERKRKKKERRLLEKRSKAQQAEAKDEDSE
jgi:hypothetical protein